MNNTNNVINGMSRSDAPLNHNQNLGSFSDIFSAGAGLIDSFVDARSERKSNESEERQLQTQLQAQREQAQADSARLTQILKFAMIGGATLLVGGIVIAVLKSDGDKEEKRK